MIAVAEYELSLQLFAGKVDKNAGVIYGATVGQSGVEATGKFLLLDKDGNITRDSRLAKQKLQIVTDDETLTTLMAAAKAAGGSTKSREDHDDSVGARVGYADNFQLEGNRVVCDIHIFENYRNRELVLETAAKTPKEIGLSIDMNPSFEVHNGRALMRIDELLAVDIVDEGAITHAGLFLNRGVDKTPKVKPAAQPSTTMADEKKPATTEDCMTAIAELSKSVGSLAASVAKMTPAAPAEGDEAAKKMAKTLEELNGKMAAQSEAIATLHKEQTALGLKVGAAPAGGSADAAAETERLRLAAEKARKGDTYAKIVADRKKAKSADLAAGKLKASDIHREVMAEFPEKYREHLKSGGIYDEAKDASRMTLAG